MAHSLTDSSEVASLSADAPTLGQRIVAALPVMYARGVSLHDAKGKTHWRSGTYPGPVELVAIRTALECFTGNAAPARMDQALPDGSSAVLLRSKDQDGEFAGFIMLLIDHRKLRGKGRAAPDLPIPVMRAAREWGLMAATERSDANSDTPNIDEATAAAVLTSNVPDNTGSLKHKRLLKRFEKMREFPIALFAQRLVPLQPDCRIRRFEILMRRDGPEIANVAPRAYLQIAASQGLGTIVDRRVVSHFTNWWKTQPKVFTDQPTQFSINLSTTSLTDRHFHEFTRASIAAAQMQSAALCFEIDQRRCRGAVSNIAILAEQLHAAGGGLVIDGFGMHEESIELLRLPGLRLLKLERQLTDGAANSRFQQAVIAGIAHMARVAGVHTVAKQVESADEFPLLTGLGIDFVQSFASSPPVRLESIPDECAAQEVVDSQTETADESAVGIPAFLRAPD